MLLNTNILTKDTKCGFLIIMLMLSSVLLFVLNLYIGYKVITYLVGDGWSFLGGFFISASYIITIPANIFAIKTIIWVKEDSRYKFSVPIVLGAISVLIGLILHNVIEFWWLIIVVSVLLLVSTFLCDRKKSSKTISFSARANSNNSTNVKVPVDDDIAIKTDDNTGVFKKMKAVQIVGLGLISLLTLGMFLPAPDAPQISLLVKVSELLIYSFYAFIAFSFFRKKRWALKTKIIINYVFLGIMLIVFFSVIIDGISLSNDFFAGLFFNVLLIALFIFLIFNYRKLLKSSMFLSVILFTLFLLPAHLLDTQKNNTVTEIHLINTKYIPEVHVDIGNNLTRQSIHLLDIL